MKRMLALAAAFTLSLAAFGVAQAQPVTRFVTGSSPGGGLDTLARALAETMAGPMGKTIIVESKPGGSYNIAAEFVARAPADGNTVLLTFNVHPIAGALNPTLNYDPVKDFRAVGMIATTPYALVANPKLPGSNLKEMIALAKTQGRSPTFASVGAGTPQHLMLERLKHQTGVDIRMVHYKSAAGALNDVIAGHVDFSLLTIGLSEPQVKAGKIKVIAVTSAQRLPNFPDAPTAKEAGYEAFVTDGWYAMLLPAKTPPAVIKQYNDALNTALTTPALRERILRLGATPAPGKPEVLDKVVRDDAAMWTAVIKQQGIKPE
ncbi:Bug family tripartite tricarboxylate transporter substrate binding protein [Ramlibacter sp.]|uniref:Bug family tripartite tricarboxylate transporter substrate binding protein n=1 Tax=Ramlibacter sp. TaxID=1917967 RepID=UPI003D1231F0